VVSTATLDDPEHGLTEAVSAKPMCWCGGGIWLTTPSKTTSWYGSKNMWSNVAWG
jgi:hypothetical protein